MELEVEKGHAELSALPQGTCARVKGLNYAFWPLSALSDVLEVERCAPNAGAPGEWVVVRRKDGRLGAQVVLEPGRTAPFGASEDGAAVPLARVKRIKSHSGHWLELPPRTISKVIHHGIASTAFRGFKRAVRLAKDGLARSGPAVALRKRALGPFTVRLVEPEDAPALIAFCRKFLPAQTAFVERQLHARWLKGVGLPYLAFDRHGQLRGFIFADEYTEEGIDVPGYWIRSLLVDPKARGLGLSKQLGDALYAGHRARGVPTLFADIGAENVPTLKILPRWGFVRAEQEIADQLNQAFAAKGQRADWTVWRLPYT